MSALPCEWCARAVPTTAYEVPGDDGPRRAELCRTCASVAVKPGGLGADYNWVAHPRLPFAAISQTICRVLGQHQDALDEQSKALQGLRELLSQLTLQQVPLAENDSLVSPDPLPTKPPEPAATAQRTMTCDCCGEVRNVTRWWLLEGGMKHKLELCDFCEPVVRAGEFMTYNPYSKEQVTAAKLASRFAQQAVKALWNQPIGAIGAQ